MPLKQSQMTHGTAISMDGHGILLTGSSGIGKSDLAIRLIDRGSKLISDDQIEMRLSNSIISLYPAPNIAGKIEVRELGIFELDYIDNIPLKLIVELQNKTDRFPMDQQTQSIMKILFPSIKIVPNQASAPLKIEMALQRLLKLESRK